VKVSGDVRWRLFSFFLGIIAAAIGICVSSKAHSAELYPAPTGFVTDVSGLLPQQTRTNLNDVLTSYRDKTSIEIAVLIIPTLKGVEPHDYADGLWKQWGIGKKGEDNGVLLLVVPPPEKIAWIQTGYGIQGWLTDVGCKHIVDDVMKPLNIQEKRAEAVVAGASAIMSKLGETPWAQRAKMTPPKDADDDTAITIAIAIVFVVLFLVFVAFVMSEGGYGGGIYGGGGGSWGGGGGSSGGDSGGGGFGGGSSGGGGGGGGSG
jgi:uncharacterized protein